MDAEDGHDSAAHKSPRQNQSRKYVAPDFKRRQLVFDAFDKLKRSAMEGKSVKRSSADKGDKGSADDISSTALYTCGAGYHGQLGVDSQRKKSKLVPSQVPAVHFKEPVLQIACGGFHTAVLTDSGKVYAWGDGRYGQLGYLARKHNMWPTPRMVDKLDARMVNISCGQSHTAAVSARGDLYTWGSGKYGQLGHSNGVGRVDQRYPKLVETDSNIGRYSQVSCGDRHTACITKKFKVVTFGSGERGQLGHATSKDWLQPKIVEALANEQCVEVACGSTFTCTRTDTGALFLWGFGESIHPQDMANIQDTPRQVKLKTRVKQVACGQSHILVLTEEGDVYAFGNGHMGQLGHGSTTNVRYPRLILKGKNVAEVAAGRYHSVACTMYGVLYSWGCGESGQLGHNKLDAEYFPRIVEPIMPNIVGQIACGEHHSLFLSSMPHQTISKDVADWKMVEDEELRDKYTALKENPLGLKTKDVLKIEAGRDAIIKKLSNEILREKEEEARNLEEQLKDIAGPEEVRAEVEALRLEAAKGSAEREERDEKNSAPSPAGSSSARKSMQPSRSLAQLKKPGNGAPGAIGMRLKDDLDPSRPSTSRSRSGTGIMGAGMSRGTKGTRSVAVLRSKPKAAQSRGSSASSTATNRQETAMTAFQPVAPHMNFIERQMLTLKKLKASMHSGPLMKQYGDAEELIRTQQEYNTLRNEAKSKARQLEKLRNAYQFMQPTEEDQQRLSEAEMRLKDLTMKLVTLQTRLLEADENKRNYELYIIRMKEEDVQLSKKIHNHQRLVVEYERLLAKMSKMNERVDGQRQEILAEMAKFENDVVDFSEFADVQLVRYRTVIDQHAVDQRTAEKNMQIRNNMQGRRRKKRLARLRQEFDLATEESQSIKDELKMWEDKLAESEQEFHQITSATGLSRPEDIINKYFFNDEITNDLRGEVASREREIEALADKQKALKEELDERKNSFVQHRWRDVDHVQDKYFQEDLRAERAKEDVNGMVQKLAAVQEGATQLVAQVEDALGPDRNVKRVTDFETTQEATVFWVNFLERRLLALNDKVKQARRKKKRAEAVNTTQATRATRRGQRQGGRNEQGSAAADMEA